MWSKLISTNDDNGSGMKKKYFVYLSSSSAWRTGSMARRAAYFSSFIALYKLKCLDVLL